jgi:hypothetical protein
VFVGEYWNKTYDDGGKTDQARGIAVDSSGNVYVTGDSNNASVSYCYTIKYNSSGSQMWNKTDGECDVAYGIAVDSSGNVYVAGRAYILGYYDYYTAKYDTNGNYLWNRTYDGGTTDIPSGVAVDNSDNVYVTGRSVVGFNYDYYTIKYNSSGSQLWNKTYNSGSSDYAYGVATDSSGNVYVTGQANSNYYTIKYNGTNGNQLWNKTYDSESDDAAYGIAVDSLGNAYVTGYSNNNYYTIKYDTNGNYLWNKTYDGGSSDYAYGVATDSSGNAYVTGDSYNGSNYNYYTIKYDTNGNYLWNKTYDSGSTDGGRGVAVDVNGNVYVTGYNTVGTQNYYTIKYKDGFVKSGQTSGAQVLASTLESQFTEVGDIWKSCATPFDGTSYGSQVCSNNLTILNVTLGNLGDPCSEGGQCISDYCTEGVCCDISCSSTCMSCLAAYNGGSDGTCGSIIDGTDPYGECTAGSWICSGSGSPSSCSRTQNGDNCNGAGACISSSSDNAPSGQVCSGGSYVAGSETYYSSISYNSCTNATNYSIGFGDKTGDLLACDGSGGANGPDVGDITTDCGTGCCYDSGSTAVCKLSGTHDVNYFDFSTLGYYDDGKNDYCIANTVKDCFDDSDCLPTGYCQDNNCRQRLTVTLIEPADSSRRYDNENITFNFSAIYGYSGIISSCSLWGNFSGAWALSQTIYTISNNTITNFDNPLQLAKGKYIWNVNCIGSDAWADNNFTLDVGEKNPPTWSDNNTNAKDNVTKYNDIVWFSINWTDDTELNQSIFSWNSTKSTSLNNGTPYSCAGLVSCIHNASLTVSATKNDALCWKFYGEDIYDNWNETDLWCIAIANSAPSKVNLYTPTNGNTTYNRTPELKWYNVTDIDGDAITYELLLSNTSDFSNIISNVTNITETADLTNWIVNQTLDVDQVYFWKVRSYDGIVYGNYSDIWNFTLQSSVIISLPINVTNFGSMNVSSTKNTTGNDPWPLLVQNDGNVNVDITINASNLWESHSNPSEYYEYKIRANESNSFNEDPLASTMNWTQMLLASGFVDIDNLKWQDDNDTALIDIWITVPSDESAGNKQSIVLLSATPS